MQQFRYLFKSIYCISTNDNCIPLSKRQVSFYNGFNANHFIVISIVIFSVGPKWVELRPCVKSEINCFILLSLFLALY